MDELKKASFPPGWVSPFQDTELANWEQAPTYTGPSIMSLFAGHSLNKMLCTNFSEHHMAIKPQQPNEIGISIIITEAKTATHRSKVICSDCPATE